MTTGSERLGNLLVIKRLEVVNRNVTLRISSKMALGFCYDGLDFGQVNDVGGF